jgi:glycosyltransferase involved in cell wall biosynthesis
MTPPSTRRDRGISARLERWGIARRPGSGEFADGAIHGAEIKFEEPGGTRFRWFRNVRGLVADRRHEVDSTRPEHLLDDASSYGDRMQAVLICYACAPGAGSEEGVGWTWALAAATIADVILLTNPFAAEGVRRAANELNLPITVVSVEPNSRLRWAATRRWGGFVYYLLWQAAAARKVRHLEATQPIDVVHHLTWATDSSPSALTASSAPVRVWGPVGGTTRMSLSLYRFLSPRARLEEIFRTVFNGCIRRVGGDRAARHATLVVALNEDVRSRFERHGTPLVIEPNCAFDTLDELDRQPAIDALGPGQGGQKTAVFVARLMGWKGALLAVDAMVHAPGWRLVIMGDGPERERMGERARSLGVEDRLEFRGRVPREEVLAALRSADALLFPSFHDSSGWAVGEATSLGCPVVCLDAGGPALLAGTGAHIVPCSPAATLAERLGSRLQAVGGRRQPDDRWSATRLPDILREWYGGGALPCDSAPEVHEVRLG